MTKQPLARKKLKYLWFSCEQYFFMWHHFIGYFVKELFLLSDSTARSFTQLMAKAICQSSNQIVLVPTITLGQ